MQKHELRTFAAHGDSAKKWCDSGLGRLDDDVHCRIVPAVTLAHFPNVKVNAFNEDTGVTKTLLIDGQGPYSALGVPGAVEVTSCGAE